MHHHELMMSYSKKKERGSDVLHHTTNQKQLLERHPNSLLQFRVVVCHCIALI